MATQRAHEPLRLPLHDVIARLQSDIALEDFSHLTGTSALVVDLDIGWDAEPAAITHAAARVRELACPVIGVSEVWDSLASSRESDAQAPIAAIVRSLDVVVSSQDLARLVDAISHHPLASMALVQLLRLGDRLDVQEALTAESLVYSTLQAGPEFAQWLSTRTPVAASPQHVEPAVIATRDGERLDLVLNRPARRNAYSAEMRDALVEALEVAVAEPSIRHIDLRGRGPAFCAGGDLAEFGTHPDPATSHAIRSTRSAARLLARCGSRVWVEVHGACVGAGTELSAFAARVIARPNVMFQLPELSMGLVPGAGGTASIPRRIGRQRTAWMALSGARIDAETAFSWGLVDEIVTGAIE